MQIAIVGQGFAGGYASLDKVSAQRHGHFEFGRFVFLDAYVLGGTARKKVRALLA